MAQQTEPEPTEPGPESWYNQTLDIPALLRSLADRFEAGECADASVTQQTGWRGSHHLMTARHMVTWTLELVYPTETEPMRYAGQVGNEHDGLVCWQGSSDSPARVWEVRYGFS